MHYEGHGKGVHKPPEVPVTAGRDMNALSNALVKQHNQGVQQAAPQMANGGIGTPLTHMMHPSAQGHGAPLASHFAGAPATNDVSRGHPDLSTHFASSAVGLPKQALGVAHDAVHSTLDHIPGGQQATNFAHGLADGVAYPGHLFSGVDNAARQVPAHLF